MKYIYLKPHPHIPVLATSGLDKAIKIWMPIYEDTQLNRGDLNSCVFNNLECYYGNLNSDLQYFPRMRALGSPRTFDTVFPFDFTSSDSDTS